MPAEDALARMRPVPAPPALLHTVQFADVTPARLALPVPAGGRLHCVELVPYQIVTRDAWDMVPQKDGFFVPDETYTKLCVVERHGRNGNIAMCPLKGYGIRGGAVATSVAHDSHNVIAAGDNDGDIALAANRLKEIGGGYVVASGGQVIGEVPLPVAGLLSEAPWQELQEATGAVLDKAKALGIPYHVDPFISLSFLALPVIPALRLTDRGLFDVTKFALLEEEI